MGDHAESEGVDGRAMAKDVPEGVLDTLRQYRPDVVEDIERAASIKRSRDIPDRSQEDKIAEDYSWLWDFEYQGVRLNAKEIEFIIQYASGGFKHIPGALVKAGFNPNTDPWAKPHVCAALHEATKSLAKAWQINPAKAARQIQNIATSNITDIADIDQNGIRLKDLNSLPREITDSIMEIHETRNHQGTQVGSGCTTNWQRSTLC